MKSFLPVGKLILALHFASAAASVTCDPTDPAFVCGPVNAEDLVRLAETNWIITSQLNMDVASGDPPSHFGLGPLEAVRIDTHQVSTLYPAADSAVDWDRNSYPDCPGPPTSLTSHGLNVRPLGNNNFRVYVANHGGRASVEIIDVAIRNQHLHATWRGCVPVPMEQLGIWPNAVAPLPDGGFVLSGYNVAIWRPQQGLHQFTSYQGMRPGKPGGTGYANGVEVSRDGQWMFIADSAQSSVIRFPVRGGKQTIVHLSFTPDNLRWGEDGRLYVAGPIPLKGVTPEERLKCFQQPICVTGIAVASINSKTLALKELVHNEEGIKDKFGTPTTALQIGNHLWMGTVRGDRLAILPLEP